MSNLLKETRDAIRDSGHTPDDIIFIGSEHSGHQCTWKHFEIIADIDYDSGFGAQEVALDLIIVFKDRTQMWRHEYDGSECWSYSHPFNMPKECHPIKYLTVRGTECVGWETLADLQRGGEDNGNIQSGD